ncbi:zinc-ribbon domain-containing protein [Clostridium thermosuccinogenes]|uniref:Zinc-ribbon domain-containing protein n=3 Tax=Clostridium thermosuccinogenes TaxID=84032 RepID=A0A2K2F2C6_9CLOT|nr:zinc-ribbon domain-containing protein [Pseudoclostridium thermosuccinogenes]PNT92941.1 zinc-ribbon domain-containing protein [Pseudoclostridium thermosuccinogenes]PNT95657.1 zinc-ribbon domain-containing protein [Pseudoclostridium thermosuccinogenes]PNT96880.1 zinc-ribbon domain-containing protein [Pseudoclostridium thermosuccinogenes]
MFFIGIFGIDQASKPSGMANNVICPACEALTRFEISKTYSYFHIFFIPVFKWNVRYYVKSACCGSLYELDPVIGAEYEKGRNPEIRQEHLRPVSQYMPFKVCSHCGARFDSGYSFCPYCGKKL